MANPSQSILSDDPRVRAALAEFFERRDRGEKVDRQSFLAQRPEIADALKSLLDADGDLAKLQGKVSSEAVTIPPDVATHSATNQNVETLPPPSGGSSPGGTSSGALPPTFGRYRVVRALGSGAMGTVYLAEDTKLHRQVALKTSSFDHDPTGELLERFYREARSAANLRSANICPVYDVDQIEGRHVISMAFIDGQPLSKSIRPDKPFSERQALLIVRKLALALQEAHDAGVIHRDLKPGNVMMDAKGEPIITDFGLARCSGRGEQARLTQSGMIIGSPAYMSPEQVEADPDKLTGATDQYSLGVILFELLTGQIPFNGSITAIIGAILTKDPPRPSELRPGLDARVESVCLKMMAKSATDRFPNLKVAAAEMATIIKALPAAGASMTGAKPASASASAMPAPAPSLAAKRPASPANPAGPATPQAEGSRESTTESSIASLTAAAKRCLARHDYDQVIQVLSPIPEARRNDEIRRLLEKARQLSDEVAFLLTEIDDALRRHDAETALQKAAALQKIQPKHPRLREVDEQCGYGKGKRPGSRGVGFGRGSGGSRRPWGVVAFGAAVFGLMLWAVTVYLRVGDATVKVTILDPDVKVGIQGRTINLESGRDPVKVRSGEGTLTILYGDLEFETSKFTLKKGENPAVVVELVNGMLGAKFGEEQLGEWPVNPHGGVTGKASAVQPWTDLLAQVVPDDKNSRGTWTRTPERHLHGDAKGDWQFPELSLGVHPAGSYELELGVIFHETDHVILHLPAGAGMANLTLIRSAGTKGAVVWQKSGPFAPRTQPAEQVLNSAIEPGKEYIVRLNIHVLADRPRVRLGGTINGEALPTLEEDPSRLATVGPPVGVDVDPLPSLHRELGLHGGKGSTTTITRLRYRSLVAPGSPAHSSSEVLTSSEYEWTEPENLGAGINTAEHEVSPALTADELTLFFIRSGDVYQSRRKSIDEPFPTATRLGPPISRANSRQSGVSVSGDGLLLVVGSDRGEGTDTDIFLFERASIDEPFQGPKPLPSPVNSSQRDHHPNLSSDGLTLVIASDRKGGNGMGDLVRFQRARRSDAFTTEENLGPVVNTPRADFGGAMSADGLVMFRSTFNSRPTNRPNEDDSNITSVMCVRQSADKPYESAIPLSGTLESYQPIGATPSPSGHRLYFVSRKPGGKGLLDLYVARRVLKKKPAAVAAGAVDDGLLPSERLTSPQFAWAVPESLGPVINTDQKEYSPSLTTDERTMVFIRGTEIYEARRPSPDAPFTAAKAMPATINEQGTRPMAASITGDGLVMAFERYSGEQRGSDIFLSERKSVDEPFRIAVGLKAPVNKIRDERHPVISLDGLSLIVSSERKGGQGMADLIRFTRSSRAEAFDNGENMGSVVNTPRFDLGGGMTADGLALFRTTFQTRGTVGVLRADDDIPSISLCTRPSTAVPFDTAVSFNNPFGEFQPSAAMVVSVDGRRIYYSTRRGTQGAGDIYLLRRVPKGAPGVAAGSSASEILVSNDWEWTEPENLGDGINTAGRELSASLTADEKTLFFTRGGDVYTSRRNSIDDPFPAATPISVGKARSEKGHISVTGDGLVLVFSATPGKRKGEDIFMSVRKSADEPFGPAEELPAPVNSTSSDRSPQISADGLSLVISSARAGVMADLYRFTRSRLTEPFGNEEHLGPVASTDKLDVGGWMSPDGLALFRCTSSKLGDDDDGIAAICTRRSTSGPFTDTHSFGSRLEVYPPRMAVASLDGKRLYFQSRRPGGKGDFDLWMSRRVPKEKGVATTSPPAIPVTPAVPNLSPTEVFTSPDFEWAKPVSLGPGVTSNLRERSPSLTADEKTMVFIRNKEIWIARRNTREEPFATAEVLPESINEPGSRNTTVSMTGDGLTIVFCSNRTGSESEDVWMSERKSLDEPFGPPQRLPDPVSTSHVERTPRLSLDGLTLFVSSPRAGNAARADIYEFTRNSRPAPFGGMKNLGPPVNSDQWDACGGISADGLILFREMSGGAADDAGARMAYHVRKSKSEPFGAAQPLGEPFDGMSALGAWLSTDGRRLYFAGVEVRRENDLFMAERVPKAASGSARAERNNRHDALFVQTVRERFPRWDADSSGLLETAELGRFVPGKASNRKEVTDLLKRLDQNADGALSEAEMLEIGIALVEQRDYDRDGRYTLPEFLKSHQEKGGSESASSVTSVFRSHDANSDGYVTVDEQERAFSMQLLSEK